jgi:hypothetical protein
LVVSFETGAAGGANSIRGIPGITFKRVDSKSTAIMLAGRLERDNRSNWRRTKSGWDKLVDKDNKPIFTGEPFATHIVDTCTSLQDIILAELMNWRSIPVQLNWGQVGEDTYRQRSEQAKEVMRLYRDLKAHTVFIAQERDHNPNKGERNRFARKMQDESFFAADLGAATVKWLHDQCDYIARLYIEKEIMIVRNEMQLLGQDAPVITETPVETGKQVRRLRTMYHPNYAAGMRSPNPEAVPEWIEAKSPKEMYDRLMKVISGQKLTAEEGGYYGC